jgi:peptidoglycan/LPS O-acetylase OafA/YrhL
MKSELVSINIGRGLAALSVFVYHYQVGHVLAKYTGLSVFNWLAYPGAIYGVPLFFVISGFCVHGSEWRRMNDNAAAFDLRAYAERRFRRIYPVYLLALLLSCSVNSNWPSWSDFWLHVFLLQGFSSESFNSINLVLWTISIEIFFYIIYPVWLILRLKIGLTRAFLIGTSLSIISCILTAVYWYPYGYPARWFFLNTWGGWLAGALLAETIFRSQGIYGTWKWWAIGVVVWTIWLWAEQSLEEGRNQILIFPMRIFICVWPLSALVLSERMLAEARGVSQFVVRGLFLIGLFSYSLYLLHVPAIVIRMHMESLVDFGKFKSIFDSVYFFVVLGVCWLSYEFVERRFILRPRAAFTNKLMQE